MGGIACYAAILQYDDAPMSLFDQFPGMSCHYDRSTFAIYVIKQFHNAQ
jgi:hypothetical protein